MVDEATKKWLESQSPSKGFKQPSWASTDVKTSSVKPTPTEEPAEPAWGYTWVEGEYPTRAELVEYVNKVTGSNLKPNADETALARALYSKGIYTLPFDPKKEQLLADKTRVSGELRELGSQLLKGSDFNVEYSQKQKELNDINRELDRYHSIYSELQEQGKNPSDYPLLIIGKGIDFVARPPSSYQASAQDTGKLIITSPDPEVGEFSTNLGSPDIVVDGKVYPVTYDALGTPSIVGLPAGTTMQTVGGTVALSTGEQISRDAIKTMPTQDIRHLTEVGIEQYNADLKSGEYIPQQLRSYLMSVAGDAGVNYYKQLPSMTDEQSEAIGDITAFTDNPYPQGTREYYLFDIQKSSEMDLGEYIASTGGDYSYYKTLPEAEQKAYLEERLQWKPIEGVARGYEFDVSGGEYGKKATEFLETQEAFNQGRISESEYREAESAWLDYVAGAKERASKVTIPPSPVEGKRLIINLGGLASYYDSLPNADMSESELQSASMVTPDINTNNPYPEGTKEWYTFALMQTQVIDAQEPVLNYVKVYGGDTDYYSSLPYANLSEEAYTKAALVEPTWDAENPYPEGTREAYLFNLQVSEDMARQEAYKVLEPYLSDTWQRIEEPTEPSQVPFAEQVDISNIINPSIDFGKIPIKDLYENNEIRNAITSLYGLQTLNGIINDLNQYAQDKKVEMVATNDPKTMQNALATAGLSDKIVWARDRFGRDTNPELAYIYADGYSDPTTPTVDVESTWAKLTDAERAELSQYWNPRDWKEALQDTVVANYVPFLGTAINWTDMSGGWKALMVVGDILAIVPFARATIVGARAVGTASRSARAVGIANAIGDEIVAQVVAPLTMLRHPIATVQSAYRMSADVVENLVNIHKIPDAVISNATGTVRIRFGKDLTPTQALSARDQIMKLAASGTFDEGIKVNLYDDMGKLIATVDVPVSPLMKEIGGGVVHTTAMGELWEETLQKTGMAMVRISEGQDGMGLFVAHQPAPRFLKSTAYGMEGEKPVIMIWDSQSDVAKAMKSSEKAYRGTAELEGVIPDTTVLWKDSPAQILITRFGIGREKAYIWLSKPLSKKQLLKLKALGIVEEFKAPFQRPISFTSESELPAIMDASDIAILQKELEAVGNYEVASRVGQAFRSVNASKGVLDIVADRELIGRDIYNGRSGNDFLNIRDTRAYKGESDLRSAIDKDREFIAKEDRRIKELISRESARISQADRLIRGDTVERIERIEEPERIVRVDDRIDRVDETERILRPDEPDRPYRPEEPDRPYRPDEPDRPYRPEEPDRPYRPDEPTRVRIPLGSGGKPLTKEQLIGAIGWKQGIMYKYIYPPYGQEDIINSREPIQGIPIKEGVRSAYETVIRTRPGFIPPNIVRHMGMMDVMITDANKDGKPEIKFIAREHRKGRGAVKKKVSTPEVFTINT